MTRDHLPSGRFFDAPPGWPEDLPPSSCLECYQETRPGTRGPAHVDRPAYQCLDHNQGQARLEERL